MITAAHHCGCRLGHKRRCRELERTSDLATRAHQPVPPPTAASLRWHPEASLYSPLATLIGPASSRLPTFDGAPASTRDTRAVSRQHAGITRPLTLLAFAPGFASAPAHGQLTTPEPAGRSAAAAGHLCCSHSQGASSCSASCKAADASLVALHDDDESRQMPRLLLSHSPLIPTPKTAAQRFSVLLRNGFSVLL